MKTSSMGYRIQRGVKHSCDRLLALVLLVLLSPVFIILSGALYIWMGAPILFRQPRPGKNAQVFVFYKFRTMVDKRDAKGELLPDEERLTEFGEFLRRTSLDELPQLWNVLKGDMSFVGPRPLLVEYLDRYSPEQARRHTVPPGITGLAQVKGRNTITWEEKFRWDVWYVDHWNLWLDLKILLTTVWKVLRREGISQEGFATAEEFKGQSQEP